MTAKLVELCAPHEKAYRTQTRGIGYKHRGVLFSEMFALVAVGRSLGINSYLESGTGNGQSAMVASRFFDVVSVDVKHDDAVRDRMRHTGVVLMEGDGRGILPSVVHRPCIVLIDGPKGEQALELARTMMKSDLVRACAIHDVGHGSPIRARLHYAHFTDDDQFVQRYSYLDYFCWLLNDAIPYTCRGGPSQSYGPTLAILTKG